MANMSFRIMADKFAIAKCVMQLTMQLLLMGLIRILPMQMFKHLCAHTTITNHNNDFDHMKNKNTSLHEGYKRFTCQYIQHYLQKPWLKGFVARLLITLCKTCPAK